MKQLAILDYMFMFDAGTTWSNGSQFEAKLSDFFAAYGFEAQVVETRGNSGKRVILLTSIEPLQAVKDMKNPQVSFKPQRQVGPQKILKQMTSPDANEKAERFNKGRFLKTKGYLKR